MQCPKCGADMVVDSHRRYPIEMCYQCGYMEGQNIEIDNSMKITVIQSIHKMNEDSLALFLTQCDFKGATEAEIRKWLDLPLKPFTKD
ncbi:MAG: hypothetical protein HFG45_00500 [Oscillospiraceae bacterium]|nr:hypothetical protein [Oscillospiraceae bacterium]